MDAPEEPTDDEQTIDEIIANVSRDHAGVVSRRRLLAAGVSATAVRARRRKGSLIQIVPQVYLVGHAALRADRIWWVSILASGGCLTGRSWLETLGHLEPRPWSVSLVIPPTQRSRTIMSSFEFDGHPIELTLRRGWEWPGEDRPIGPFGLPGVDLHAALTRVAAASQEDFDEALREAEYHRQLRDDRLREMPRKGRRGSGRVRARAEKRAIQSMRVRNGFEEEGVELFARLGMPTPETNVIVQTPLGPADVDFLFRHLGPAGLAIEFDGKKAHGSVGGAMRDHEKDAKLRSAGIDVMHFDWWQGTRHPDQIAAALIGAGYLPAKAA